MRYIKFYENSVEDTTRIKEYFKNKIDWKFYNFLRYNLMKIEDKGAELSLLVSVCEYDGKYMTSPLIHIYSTNSQDNYARVDFDRRLKCYNKDGLFYIITLRENYSEFTDDLIKSIEDRCNFVDINWKYYRNGGRFTHFTLTPKY